MKTKIAKFAAGTIEGYVEICVAFERAVRNIEKVLGEGCPLLQEFDETYSVWRDTLMYTLGVPPDLSADLPGEMVGETYCWDFMYEASTELVDGEMTVEEFVTMLRDAAKEGDNVTSERARLLLARRAETQKNTLTR